MVLGLQIGQERKQRLVVFWFVYSGLSLLHSVSYSIPITDEFSSSPHPSTHHVPRSIPHTLRRMTQLPTIIIQLQVPLQSALLHLCVHPSAFRISHSPHSHQYATHHSDTPTHYTYNRDTYPTAHCLYSSPCSNCTRIPSRRLGSCSRRSRCRRRSRLCRRWAVGLWWTGKLAMESRWVWWGEHLSLTQTP